MKVQASLRDTCWTVDVYPPSDDSFALVDALQTRLESMEALPELCLEVGSGSGYVCASLALMLEARGQSRFTVVATDVNEAATRCTAETARRHGVAHRLNVVQTKFWDGLRILDVTSRIDLILFNPPYVPTPDEEVVSGGIAAAWAGGEAGRVVIDAFLDRIRPLVRRGRAEVMMVAIEQNSPQRLVEELRREGFLAEILLKRRADEELLSVLSIRPGAGMESAAVTD